ncbi:MAG: porin family protein [Ginsengibacter sp.]
MKTKVIPIVVLLFFISSSLFSQGISFGLKAGANLGKITGESFKDEFTFAYHAGAFLTISGKKWGIQPEVLFSQVNADTAMNFNQVIAFKNVEHIQLKALTIPIMINYNLSKFITLQAGPQFGIILDQSNDLLQNGKDAFKTGNFALAAGLQLNILKLKIYGRFVGGVTDISNIENSDTWKVQNIQVGIGLALF